MSRSFVVLLLFCLSLPVLFAGENRISIRSSLKPKIVLNDEVTITMKNEDVYIRKEARHPYRMIIMRDDRLFLDGDEINLNQNQKKFVHCYVAATSDILEGAKKIGREGARIGMQGAGLGLKAVVGVARLLLPNYDADDLEYDMEESAARIEMKAHRLEEKADSLELELDVLEELHEELEMIIGINNNEEWL